MRCMRCGRRNRMQPGWNVVMKGGKPVGLLCPDCQTPEENAEAEINMATTTYSRDAFGRIIGAAKEAV